MPEAEITHDDRRRLAILERQGLFHLDKFGAMVRESKNAPWLGVDLLNGATVQGKLPEDTLDYLRWRSGWQAEEG